MGLRQALVWGAGLAVLAVGAFAAWSLTRGSGASFTGAAAGEAIKVGDLTLGIERAADGVTVNAVGPNGARHVLPLKDGTGARFLQVQVFEPSADLDGDGAPEAIVGLSTGGMGCCLSVSAVPTNGKAPLALLDLGAGMDVAPIARPGAPGGLIVFDDAAVAAYDTAAFAPMGRLILRWDGARWVVDAGAMAARGGLPAFWTGDPPAAEAWLSRSQEDDFLPMDRSDAARLKAEYDDWRAGLIGSAAGDELADPGDPGTFITSALALNAYVYAGEAAAGAAALRRAFGPKRAALADAILAHHFAALDDSRFRTELLALNGGAWPVGAAKP